MTIPASQEQVTVELKTLLDELRRRHWTLMVWGPRDKPDLVVSMFKWQTCVDVLILRSRTDASAYRAPAIEGSPMLNPEVVSYQYHAPALWTLRAILGLPEPGKEGAPMGLETPVAQCQIPEGLPKPIIVRPLGTN